MVTNKTSFLDFIMILSYWGVFFGIVKIRILTKQAELTQFNKVNHFKNTK